MTASIQCIFQGKSISLSLEMSYRNLSFNSQCCTWHCWSSDTNLSQPDQIRVGREEGLCQPLSSPIRGAVIGSILSLVSNHCSVFSFLRVIHQLWSYLCLWQDPFIYFLFPMKQAVSSTRVLFITLPFSMHTSTCEGTLSPNGQP